MNRNLPIDLKTVAKKLIVVTAFFSLQFTISAQTWSTAFGFGSAAGGELGKGVAMDASGNSYYVGIFGNTVDFDPTACTNNLASAGITDVVVTKYNAAGVYQWAVKGGGASTDQGNGIATDGTSVYITGTFTTSATFGATVLTGAGGTDIFVAKLDAATGAFQWAVNFGSAAGGEAGIAVCVDGSGNPYVTGNFNGTTTFGSTVLTQTGGSGTEMFVVKLNPVNGAVTWASGGGGSAGNDFPGGAGGICFVPSTNRIVVACGYNGATATYGSTTITNTGNNDIAVVELNATTGAFISAVDAGTANNDEAFGACYDASTGDVMITGYFNGASITFGGNPALTNAGGDDAFVARYSPSTHTFIWSKGFGNTSVDRGNGICSNGAGGIYVVGQFRTSITLGSTTLNASGAFADPFIGAFKATDGSVLWAIQAAGNSATLDDIGKAIAVGGPSGKVAVTGQYATATTFGATVLNSTGSVDIFVATLAAPLSSSITSSSNITCNVGCNGTATVTASGGTSPYSYSWSPSGGTAATATGLCAGTYTVTATDALSNTSPSMVTITMPANQLSTATTTNTTFVVSANNNSIYDAGCNLIAKLVPSGASPVSGTISAKVWVESGVPLYPAGTGKPFAARHYEITPATNAATATGTLTLYFKQAEFTAFNSDPRSTLDLPTGPADATGIANLLIGKYPGSSSDNSGFPNTYSGTSSIIDPVNSNVVWNGTASQWEVTFAVTGFSGFVVQTSPFILPITFTNVTGNLDAQFEPVISWQVQEQQVLSYTVERSTDGSSFTAVGVIPSKGDGNNNYSFRDNKALFGNAWYRIKQTGKDGQLDYSTIIQLKNTKGGWISFSPNPVKTFLTLHILDRSMMNSMMRLYDINGRELQRINIGQETMVVDLSKYAGGIYILSLQNGQNIRLLKQ